MEDKNSEIVFMLSEIREAADHAGPLQPLKLLLTELALMLRMRNMII